MKTTFIKPSVLKAFVPFCSTETTRYYICGVLIECAADSITYVATDGHKMMVHHHEIDPCEDQFIGSLIVPNDALKKIRVNKSDSIGLDILQQLDGREFNLKLSGVSFTAIDGTFPDWRRVLPAESNPERIGHAQFNWEYLSHFWKAAKALGLRKPAIDPAEETFPHWINFGDPNTFGVLMPLRNGYNPMTRPSWMTEQAQAMEQIAA